ncbi:alpha/beta fold hydrolase [Streptomyces sp. NPDC056544]|uniref:alpha/beta fold hydrolase n=1 Tax=unclassified Streptomyces TaxID=2593676 RepID=UPI0036B59465
MSYADINGLSLYYEEHGSGEPLVLLHGGLSAGETFGPILPLLAEHRRVITVDLQAHGRTTDIDRPLRPEWLADDIAGLIQQLGLEHADMMGYSFGGWAALCTAIRHPHIVRRLVLVSTPCKRDGWFPEALASMSQMGPQLAEPMKQSPVYDLYSRLAPRLQDWPVLLTKIGELLRQEYDWSAEVAAIKAPTMLVFADADSVRPAHMVEFFELLGGGLRDAGWDGSGRPTGQLAILPGATHYDIFASPALAAAITPFLDAPVPQPEAQPSLA